MSAWVVLAYVEMEPAERFEYTGFSEHHTLVTLSESTSCHPHVADHPVSSGIESLPILEGEDHS